MRQEGTERSAGTGIYFLLPAGVCTSWHRVDSDELWHFYEGDPLNLEILTDEGTFQQLSLGRMADEDARFQGLVPDRCWQRAYSTGAYSLVGCTVCPGFEFEAFEMIESEELAERYPDHRTAIMDDPFPE